jgi:tetratricopeptide (TPR) repeat protein
MNHAPLSRLAALLLIIAIMLTGCRKPAKRTTPPAVNATEGAQPSSELSPDENAILLADQALANGDYETAIAILQDALIQLPDNLVLLRMLTQVLMDIGAYPEANDTIGRILTIDPDDFTARCVHADILTEMGHYAEAAEAYESLLTNDPPSALRQRLLFDLAVTYQADGLYANACRVWLQYLELNDEDAEAHTHIAVALEELGDLHQAFQHVRRASVLELDNLDAQLSLANTARALHQFGWVVIGLQRATAIEPNDPSLWNQLGAAALTFYEAGGDPNALNDAIDAWEQSLTLDPNQPIIQSYIDDYPRPTP